jgi:hypothetical protein
MRVHLAAVAGVCTRWSVHTVCTVYTQCVHTCQMFTTSGWVQLYTVRQYTYRVSVLVRCMAASDVRISTSSSGFSIWIFLRAQICRILNNFFDFSKVPDHFSTSWNSDLLFRRQPYAIMATVPNTYGYGTKKQNNIKKRFSGHDHC